MSKAIREHIRSNVVGYIAIFMFAMGGTAYATHPGGADTISSGDIIDGEVKTVDINNANGVRSADVRDDTLADGGLQAVDLRPDSVGSSEVAPDSLDAVDLNAGSVGASEVSDESLGSDELAPNSVGSSEVATDAIGSGEVAPDSLAAADLAPDSVGSSEVATDAIGGGEVAPDSLAAGDLAPDSVGSSELAADTISSGEIIDGQVANSDLAPDSVTGPKVAFGSLTGTDILNESLSGTDILDGSLTSSDIGAGAVGSSEVANASLTTGEFASSIPAARVTRTISQGIAHDTVTTLNFNSERYDTAGLHSNTSNISRLTAPVTGIYEVTVSFHWDGNLSGYRIMTLFKNGTTLVENDGIDADTGPFGGVDVNNTTMLRLAAGDYVEVGVYQNSGGNLSILRQPEVSPEFSMTWLAPGP
jgi:hypothetical protein